MPLQKLLLNFFMIFSSLIGFSQHHAYTHISTGQGLPNAYIYGCQQDKSGNLWICTESGLVKYDGYNFTTYDAKHGIDNNEIIAVAEDNTGKIWFSCFSDKSSLLYYHQGKIISSKQDPSLRDFDNFTFLNSANIDSSLFLGSRKGLIEIIHGVPKIKYQITPDNLFVTNNKNLLILSSHKPSFTPNYISILHNGRQDTLMQLDKKFYQKIFFSQDTAYIIDGKTIKVYQLKNNQLIYINSCITSQFIDKLYINELGFWLIAKNESVLYFAENFESLKKGHLIKSIENTDVQKVYQDQHKNVWISTSDKGLYLLKNKAIYHYNYPDLKSNFLYSIFQNEKEQFLLGTNDGNIIVTDKNKNKTKLIDLSETLTKRNRILQIGESNNAIVVSNDEGAWLVKPESKKRIIIPNSKSFCILNDSCIMFSIGSQIFLYNTKRQQVTHKTSTNRIFSQTLFQDSLLWLGGLEGLKSYNLKTQQLNKQPTSPSIDCRINTIVAHEGMLLIGTNTQGIIRIKNNKIIDTLSPENSLLPSYNILKLKADHHKFYAATNKGYVKFWINNQHKIIQSKSFSMSDGLPSDQINDLIAMNDTTYLATNDGLVMVDENAITPKQVQLNIDLITIDNKPLSDNKRINLFDHQHLIIYFTGIELSAPEKITYQYNISPNRSNWTQTSQRFIDINNFAPGHYKITIRASTTNNTSTSVKHIDFTIQPKWWQTIAFKIIAAFAFILINILFFIWLKKYIRIKAEKKAALQHRMVRSELEALRSQMNPHFIFNSMNVLQDLIMQNQPTQATQFVSKFSKLIRAALQLSKRNWIYLQEEIQFLEQYIQLENLRLQHPFKFNLELENLEEIEQIEIPSMMLQPYIENAINHGIKYLPSQEQGLLFLRIKKQKNRLLIDIEDNGIGIHQANKVKNKNLDKHKSLGMKITKDRIDLINENFNMQIECNILDKSDINPNMQGTLVQLIIPIQS
ncbi:MAG: histidine kinase [Chitinophagaceae bacterium]|nr:histidine kinase [Chitinophagaceae bacterium]